MFYKSVLNYFKNDKINYKKVLLIVFIVSLAIRLLFGILIFNKGDTSQFKGDNDHWDYINYAKNIISQGIFVPDIEKLNKGMSTPDGLRGTNASFVGPGFPLIIAFVFKIFGENYLSLLVLIVLNALVSSLLCVLIFYIGRELFNEQVGLFASIWSIFYISFIRYSPTLYKENWIVFLFPLIIFLFLKETKRKKISLYSLILFSILYAYFIHMDERFFTYFPVLLMGFVFLDRDSWKKGLQKAFVFFSLVVILMIPWLTRNFNVYNRVVILTERTAVFTDKIFGYKDEIEKVKNKKEKELAVLEKVSQLILEGKEVPPAVVRNLHALVEIEYLEPLKKAIKLGYIPHRYSRLEKWVADFKQFWRPFRFSGGFIGDGYRFVGPSWSLKHNLVSCLNYGWILPFFIIGILIILKNKDKYGIFITLIIVIHTCIHVILAYALRRYRIPIDAFVMIIAFYGLQQLYVKFQDWKMSKVR